jgi:phage protein D
MAAAPIPLYSPDQKETFYVPAFEVYIRGQKLKDNIISDVLQVTYKDSINEIDSFNIEINNWDAEKRVFKFTPPVSNDFVGIFNPGAPIELWMGYAKNLRMMMRGQVTSLEPNFSESAPTLSVRGLNELHQFRTEQHTYSWLNDELMKQGKPGKTDTQIAQELGSKPVQKGQPGLDIPVRPNPAPDEGVDPLVFMNNQYDIVFLLERARRHGYEVYLETINGKQDLYFGLSENKGQAAVYQLEWGKSLINFKPSLTTAKQVAQVTVRGWDRKANQPIEESFTLKELWTAQNLSDAEIAKRQLIAQAYGNRTEVVTDKPVYTKQQAKQMARSILEDTDKKLIEATASTVGLPDLRAGSVVFITGFGPPPDANINPAGVITFDGKYYVKESTHTIGGSGYRTDFSVRREGS